ncbi:C39 family peptidase [Bacillus toyonensis]|uniref:C39 family peptidase n=2 Tax=Bacillus toyonensis TaxID=155322 RepID=UPI001CB8ADBF|nr:C39 family peptidase [Bacillus toyonensis]
MKKLILSASCTLACGILLSSPEYSKAEEVSKQPTVTKEEAQYKAESYIKGVSEKSHQNWKDAQIGQSTILYDLEGQITGYAFQVKKDNQDKGYIIASSEKQTPSIIESTREGKYPYQQVEEGQSIYTGPLQHYKKVDRTIVNLHTEQTIDIKTAKQQIETTKPKDSTERTYSPKKKLAQDQPAFKENSIPNVPDNQWYYGCTPTAVSNIAEYWAQNGYNNLKYSNETTDQIIEKLGKNMKTIPGKKLPGRAVGGSTITDDMVPGIKKYWNERGYYPEVNLDTTPTYEEYTKEIDAGRPITVNIINDPFYSNHSVTGVGYEQMYIPEINEDFKNLVLHDTWEDSPVEAYYSYNDGQKYIHSTITINPSAKGWILDSDNKWHYRDSSGAMKTGWVEVFGKWYYLDSTGAMKTGWVEVFGKWYYLDSNGAMKTGWTEVSGKWYYLDSNGAMKTGWAEVSAKWYYLDSNGAMKTGWLQENGNWYYLQSDGAMAIGKHFIDGKWYSFKDNGVMM